MHPSRAARPTSSRRSFVVMTALIGTLVGSSAGAMTREVPNQDPDIQTAIGILAGGGNIDADNHVWITQTPLFTNQTIVLTNAFSQAKRITIEPKPGLLSRAEIINNNPNGEIVFVSGSGGVTLRALDLIRGITNLSNLMTISNSEDVLMERCRLGYTSLSKGGSQLDMLQIIYPNHVVVRNCVLFSLMPGEFDRAINVVQFGDPQNSLFLYNNDIANYGVEGIRIGLAAVDSSLLVMRNNVLLNDPTLPTEPFAYSSGSSTVRLRVRSSHNMAFSSAAAIEKLDPGAFDVAGAALPDFLRLDPTQASEDGAFVTRTWNLAPGDPNADFYHLVVTASLHFPASTHGVTVTNGSPTPLDEAVFDDIDHEGRPSAGSDPHTDRGADQVDPSALALAVGPDHPAAQLRVAPLVNPSRAIALAFVAPAAGVLSVQVYDAQGRRIWATHRTVGAGTGTLDGPAATAGQVAFYRVSLKSSSGATTETAGRIVLVR